MDNKTCLVHVAMVKIEDFICCFYMYLTYFFQESSKYVNELVKPVLACFRDSDSQVRYYSCEALYNIVKVTRGSVLPFFNEIFDALSKVCTRGNLENFWHVCY